jgi:hypothetical protein
VWYKLEVPHDVIRCSQALILIRVLDRAISSLAKLAFGLMTIFNVFQARSHFPALNSGYIFADNAGGSQAAKEVVDRISDYLLNTNVQLGADYSVSVLSTNRVLSEGPNEAAKLLQARSPDEVVFGSSSTLNLENLSRGLDNDIQHGDEFIVTGEHEGMCQWPFSIESRLLDLLIIRSDVNIIF